GRVRGSVAAPLSRGCPVLRGCRGDVGMAGSVLKRQATLKGSTSLPGRLPCPRVLAEARRGSQGRAKPPLTRRAPQARGLTTQSAFALQLCPIRGTILHGSLSRVPPLREVAMKRLLVFLPMIATPLLFSCLPKDEIQIVDKPSSPVAEPAQPATLQTATFALG